MYPSNLWGTLGCFRLSFAYEQVHVVKFFRQQLCMAMGIARIYGLAAGWMAKQDRRLQAKVGLDSADTTTLIYDAHSGQSSFLNV